MKEVVLARNQIVYKEGDEANGVYFVKYGQFEVSKMMFDKN
jgi:CRP-like cAMP-binding protein